MQTLWTRVAQSGSGVCACPQCLQSVQAVSRRATASATRRAPRYLTSSTLVYSGVFAAAATYDAGRKQKRREQWDLAIAGVKAELGETMDIAEDLVKQKAPAGVSAGVVHLFKDVEPSEKRAQWPANTGPPLMRHRLAPQSIYASGRSKKRAESFRWLPKKLERAMLSMDILQLVLWKEMQMCDDANEALSTIPEDYRRLMPSSQDDLDAAICSKVAHLDYIQHGVDPQLTGYSRHPLDIPLCRYLKDDHGNYHETARELNSALQDLFVAHHRGAITSSAMMAKIAYNLHISSAPPNVHTHNTLLLGFEQAGQTKLVGAVVGSVEIVMQRANEVTHACMLRHFTATNNAKKFSRLIGQMRGKHGGVGLARSDIVNINETAKSRLVRRPDRLDKIMQLPYPTPTVFASIIEGMLEFAGFETALRVCEAMGSEGWGLCRSGFTPLLNDCADTGNWASGMVVWKEMQTLKTMSQPGQQGLVRHRLTLETYAAMLRLCSKCDQKAVYDDVWATAIRNHKRSEWNILALLRSQEDLSKRKMQAQKFGAEGKVVSDPYLRLTYRPPSQPRADTSEHEQEAAVPGDQTVDECIRSARRLARRKIRTRVFEDLQQMSKPHLTDLVFAGQGGGSSSIPQLELHISEPELEQGTRTPSIARSPPLPATEQREASVPQQAGP